MGRSTGPGGNLGLSCLTSGGGSCAGAAPDLMSLAFAAGMPGLVSPDETIVVAPCRSSRYAMGGLL